MSSQENHAAYLQSKQSNPLVVAPTSPSSAPPKPGPGEILIRNAAVAINPVDWKIQDSGYFIQSYPWILGTDVAGTVEEVGEGVDGKRFGKGARVIGHAISLGNQKNEYSAFQNFTLVPAVSVSTFPHSLSFAQASVLPLAINTAVTGLYPQDVLGLPYPTADEHQNPPTKTIVVIGGSSSVGTVAVQLARASGIDVISTASAKNHEYVKNLGASVVFDHSDSDVVKQITEHIKNSGLTFAGIYDAISLPNTHDISFGITKTLLSNAPSSSSATARIATTLPAPEDLQTQGKGLGITFHNVFAVAVVLQMKEISEAVWWDFLPKALETGRLRALPEALVVGKGLESIQKGLDRQKEGVSAKKVVVEL